MTTRKVGIATKSKKAKKVSSSPRATRTAKARKPDGTNTSPSLSPEQVAQVLELAPPAPLQTKRTTQDLACLRADYELGKQLAHRSHEQLRALLS